MYYRVEQLIATYPMENLTISRGRGGYLGTDAKGNHYVFNEYKGSKGRLLLLRQILTYLKSSNVVAEEYVDAKEQRLCYEDDEGIIFCTTKIDGTEYDMKQGTEMAKAFQGLAALHLALEQFEAEGEEKLFLDGLIADKESVFHLCERRTAELKKLYNFIRNKKKRNAFEAYYLGMYQGFEAQAKQALEVMGELEKTALLRKQLLHGACNQHQIINARGKQAVLHLEQFTYGNVVDDISMFLRKILEKNNWDIELAKELLAAYESLRPLDESERRCLYARLLYPEKFQKVANRYYNNKKTWISGRNIEKLEQIQRQENDRQKFLQQGFLQA